MAGPSPINSACNCCLQPPEVSVGLQYVSAGQECFANQCGEQPCTSDIFEEYPPNDQPPVTICSPNFGYLSREDQCIGTRYLTKTESSTAFGFLGRIRTTEFSISPNPDPEYPEGTVCLSTVTCSGSHTITQNASGTQGSFGDGFGTYQSLTTVTWPSDCSSGIYELTSCSGTSIGYNEDGDEICNNTVTGPPSCNWTPYNFPCVLLNFDPITFNPSIENKVEITYTNPNDVRQCDPVDFPNYPDFQDCVPEGTTPLPPPVEYESGQGEGDVAYVYQGVFYPQLRSEQRIKYRVEHTPTASCFLKVWFREKIQEWKIENCDTGFAGDPPRTEPVPPQLSNCDPETGGFPCLWRWSTDGPPTYQEKGSYIWSGSDYPCFNDKNKLYTKCENKIYSSSPKTATASENQSITIEFKYSEVEGYVPNWPDENGSQGCKPNGYPIANPENCP